MGNQKEIYNIDRTFKYDKSKLRIVFDGKSDKKIKKEEIYDSLDYFMNRNYGNDIRSIIYNLRIICRNLEEIRIYIQKESLIDSIEVYIENKEVEKVTRKEIYALEHETLHELYDKEKGYNFSVETKNRNLANKESIAEQMKKFLTFVSSVNVHPDLNFSKKEKVLIEMYREFYDELPNFNELGDEIKTKSLMYMLTCANISIDDEKIDAVSASGIPISMDIQSIMDTLAPFGDLTKENVSKVLLTEECKNKMQMIKNLIKNYDESMSFKTMEKIVKAYYIYNSRNQNIMGKLMNIDEEEAKNLLRFIEILDSAINPVLYYEKDLSELKEEAKTLGLKMKEGN